jgi:DNA-binding response OmpR family regulator
MTGERILIVEDEPAVARGLEYGLQKEGFDVLWAESGEQALALVAEREPDLILLDVRLPGINGFDVCRQLRDDGWRQPIVMLTARDEEPDRVLGLELGADDYVVKPFSLRELVSRVRAQLRRAYGELASPSGDVVRFGDVVVDMERWQVQRDGREIALTPIEFKLLRHLVANGKRPLTRQQLIDAVWGYTDDVGSERTVDVHIRHLREKLEADPSDPRWLVTVRGVGYKFEP